MKLEGLMENRQYSGSLNIPHDEPEDSHLSTTWLVDGRWLAQEVRNAGDVTACHQIPDCELECPKCEYCFDDATSDVSHDWPRLPAGVKFDPSDVELLQHYLAAKCGEGNLQPHEFINEFIPTLDDDEGICYTHPETLPGAKKDGRCIHFFYKVTNAYTTGARKRRRIEDANVRWHKTGKTKRIKTENRPQIKGFKKIMVLQGTSAPEKCRWVMHQYHLGSKEDENEGEYVVCKIFYQPQKKACKDQSSVVISESEMGTVEVIPRTIMNITQPRLESFGQEKENEKSFDHPLYGSWSENQVGYASCSTAESDKATDLSDTNLVCSDASFSNSKQNNASSSQVGGSTSNANQLDADDPCGFGDLDDLECDTHPGFQLHDLQFAQQDIVSDGLDWL